MAAIPEQLNSTNTRIVVDTSSNVPDELLRQYRMIEVPTLVIFGQDSYRNKHELSEAAFYEKFAASKVLPTTSQPPPSFFTEAYTRAFEEGASHILVVTVSSKVSGTFRSAQMAAQEMERSASRCGIPIASAWVAAGRPSVRPGGSSRASTPVCS